MDNLPGTSGEIPSMGLLSWAEVFQCNPDKEEIENIRNALIKTGIMDQVCEEGMEWVGVIYVIHNWEKAAGKLKVKQQNRSEYMKNYRSDQRQKAEEQLRVSHVTVQKEKEKDKEKDKTLSKSHSPEVPSGARKTQWSHEWLPAYQNLIPEPPPAGPSCKYLNKLAGTYTQLEVSTVLLELSTDRKQFQNLKGLNAYLTAILKRRMGDRANANNRKGSDRKFFGSAKQDAQWAKEEGGE